MSTKSWSVAPTGYLVDRGTGLPVAGMVPPSIRIGVRLGTAALFGSHSIADRFNGTPLGIPSSRRPLS